jgi:polysaccharide deacetylase family protein (PEP-CTERM system associated)
VKFRDDITRGKQIIEDITGKEVTGFRAAGFGIKDDTPWAFDEIRRAGYRYDSSVFPASRGHGGMQQAPLGGYVIETVNGPLVELPMSVVEILGHRVNFFGGGYLRLFPLRMIKWGIRQVHRAGHPLIIYIHPREIDPEHPRLPLGMIRRFKSYVGLRSTMPKISWLCRELDMQTMSRLADAFRGA